jgi:hypothetical protein
MKISFDGIGFHDWIRQREGAQEQTIAAMELCVENGIEVVSNTQVNRRNVREHDRGRPWQQRVRDVPAPRLLRRWMPRPGPAVLGQGGARGPYVQGRHEVPLL